MLLMMLNSIWNIFCLFDLPSPGYWIFPSFC
jgi:hypothetical protein